MNLGFSQEAFSDTYGIPLASLRQYEIARYMPPPAVRALFALIEADPEHVASVLAKGDRWKPKEWAA